MFYSDIKKSLYNPIFYQDINRSSRRQAVSYFFKLLLLEAFFASVFVAIFIVPTVLSRKNLDALIAAYPAELKISLKGGMVTTNVKEPFIIPLPEQLHTVGAVGDLSYLKNLLVIDTLLPVSIDRFREFRTVLLLSRDSLVTEKRHLAGITMQSLRSFPDMTIGRAEVSSFIDRIHPYIAPVLIIGSFVIGFLTDAVSWIILILLTAILGWAVVRMRGMPLTYKQIVKLGLYSVTGVVLLEIAVKFLSAFVYHAYIPWYANALLLIATMAVNMRELTAVSANNN